MFHMLSDYSVVASPQMLSFPSSLWLIPLSMVVATPHPASQCPPGSAQLPLPTASTQYPPPGSHTSSSLLYKLIFKNLACKSFCLKDKEFTLTAPHAWRKFFSLLLQPLVIPPTDSWPVWCQPLPRLFSLFISKSVWGGGHRSSDTS